MKDIGVTPQGNRIVEMNENEHREFSRLRSAIEGNSMNELVFIHEHQFREDFDFTNTFHVIRAYYLNKFWMREFRELLNSMEDAMKKG